MKLPGATQACTLTAGLLAAVMIQGCFHTAVQKRIDDASNPAEKAVLFPALVATSAVALAGYVAAAPVAAVSVPLVDPNVRQQMATQARNEENWARPGHSLGSSVALVEAELRFHLPPTACKAATRQRLKVTVEGGGCFSRKTYDIVAVGDFTPARLEKFLNAAKRLHGHLEPAPRFRLHVYHNAGEEAVSVGVFEFS